MAPFALLAELAPHEHQLLAGMAEHEAVIGPQIGETLPVVAGHAAENRAFAVHDLVVRQRQNEIFRKRVVQAERDLAVVMLAIDRILADVVERVVHPPHVPFVAEAEAAPIDRPRHHRPGGRFLRRRRRFGEIAVKTSVLKWRRNAMASRFSRPPMLVGNPAALRPAVIEIKHRGDGIDAQPVDAVAIEPEQPAGEQEIGDFGAPEIVDQRIPIEMPALLRIGVLVERGAVEAHEAVRIIREMPRHPIEQYRRARRDGRRRQVLRNRPGCRTGWWVRTFRSADSPRSRRTDAR